MIVVDGGVSRKSQDEGAPRRSLAAILMNDIVDIKEVDNRNDKTLKTSSRAQQTTPTLTNAST